LTKSNWNELLKVAGNRFNDFRAKRLASKSLLVTSWRMILFISTLAILVIYSSHKVDQKVIHIAKLNEELKELRSMHIDMRTRLMSLSKSTKVAEDVQSLGLQESMQAPYKILMKD